MNIRSVRLLAMAVLLLASPALAQDTDAERLAAGLRPFFEVLSNNEPFTLSATVQAPIDGKPIPVELRLARFDDQSFDLDVIHSDYSVRLRRRKDLTAFALPHHKVVFLGRGHADKADHMLPTGLIERLISPASTVGQYAPLVIKNDIAVVAPLLLTVAKLEFDAKANTWSAGKDVTFSFASEKSLELTVHGLKSTLQRTAVEKPLAADDWTGFKAVDLDRSELERQLVRGIRRATEVLAPSKALTKPDQKAKAVAHGELRWIGGQRVVLLSGTPEQIGTAHGQLLGDEAARCIDSVLYSFGTFQTIRTGHWFRHDLEQAYSRLSPHIPERHKQETRAMAVALNLDPKLAEALNVFPEMFHCSGFAVFGSATQGGKLYHGRVLDYMTSIGLQDSATTFIVAVDGKIPFANVGYAGFIGSVSGMNAKAISLGEMGGRGEGNWDGVPMATLMRRALEECTTLDEVMNLWKTNPRTCEYYYVFADGKTNRAVGVAALPESIEFIEPGQSDPRLGDGIKDAVVLSAGSRLQELRSRVTKSHGSIDAEVAQSFMCRPVAMQSNLHNVLFVPEDGVLYVANADHKSPAAERPYVKLNLNELLGSMKVVTQK